MQNYGNQKQCTILIFIDFSGFGMLAVEHSAVGASANAVQWLAAVAAQVLGYVLAAVSVQRSTDVDAQQGVADIDLRGLREDEVQDEPHAGQSQRICQYIVSVQLLAYVIQRGNEENQRQPGAQQEHADGPGLYKGVERRCKVVGGPHVGGKLADGGVEGRPHGNRHAQQGGVERVNVVEVYDGQPLVLPQAVQVEQGDHPHQDEKGKQVVVAEGVDGLRDGVAWDGILQQDIFGNPAHDLLVVGHLDVECRVAVGVQLDSLGHYDFVTSVHPCGFLAHGHCLHTVLRKEGLQFHGIAADHEIVVDRKVARQGKLERVALLLWQVPAVGGLVVAVGAGAGHKRQQKEEQPMEQHI